MSEKEAFAVEASVIDLLGLADLTNRVTEHNSCERGRMNARDIIARYNAKPITIEESTLLITVNKLLRFGMTPAELYEITRGNWAVGKRSNEVKYAFVVYKGVVREV